MAKYTELANDIVTNVGGAQNVKSVYNCMTRLRFELKDQSLANDDWVKNNDQLVGLVKSGSEYQIVVGNHVPDVYTEVAEVIHNTGGSAVPVEEVEGPKRRKSPIEMVQKFVQGAFMPTLPILLAGGMSLGLLSLLTNLHILSETSTLYRLWNAVGMALFWFFPIFVGFTVARHLKMNEFLGAAIGAALMIPDIQNLENASLFGIDVSGLSYSQTVIPVMLTCLLAAPLYRFLEKHIPAVIKRFVVPLIVMWVVVPIGYAIIGPFAQMISNGIATFSQWIAGVGLPIAGFVLGALWQVLVVFGVHQAVYITVTSDIIAGHASPIMAFFNIPSFAMLGVVFVIWLKTRDKKLKDVAFPAWISAIFGITEPAIYGVALPRIKFFIIACIGAAIGTLYQGLMHVTIYNPAGYGIFAATGAISPDGSWGNLINWAISALIALAVASILTWIFYRDPVEAAPAVREEKRAEEHHLRAINEARKAEIHHELAMEEGTGLNLQESLIHKTKIGTRPTASLSSAAVAGAGAGAAGAGAVGAIGAATTATLIAEAEAPTGVGTATETIQAPLTGQVIPLSEVADPAFSGGMMGDGVAIVPTEGKLVAPFDGEIVAIFPTAHAVGIRSESGAEVLMHIGIDTVSLGGKHFSAKVTDGQHVKAGDTLVEFDIPAIEAEGYSVTTPVIITNGEDFPAIENIATGNIARGEALYSTHN